LPTPVGSAPDSWRTAQARDQCRSDHGCKIHGQEKAATVAGLEDLSSQSRRWYRVDRYVCRSFRLLYGSLVVQHSRRELLWLGVTAHPTAEWIAHQLTEAFGWSEPPRYIIRDRDGAYGSAFIRRLTAMGIRDRPISTRSPWQNGVAERLIRSIRRNCLDHVVIFGERHLRHLLNSYQQYCNEARTHLSLRKDAPMPRQVQRAGRVLALPILGGLHHRYVRV
jgi:transposase InsO family protein